MLLADKWKDYEIIDTGNGEKLERWGQYYLRRPDPQVIWPISAKPAEWERADAIYHRSSSGGGEWEYKKKLPDRWVIKYENLSFYVQPLGFKHTGVFPEQAVNWSWMMQKIKNTGHPVRVLNLFAYTGSATAAAASACAEVCHVDAAKGMVIKARQNLELSGLADKPVRLIVDDAVKFVQREIRRGSMYEAVIMDPPAYGRGPKGEIWKLEDELYNLVKLIAGVFSDKPLFFILNSYTTGLAPSVLKNIIELCLNSRYGGIASADEIGIPVKSGGLVLPCGATGRWEHL
ncbi:MAG: class I SAM-dependent methyltransferase [Eubacteriales bacterium]|nr:class I SAM-dependent methyltransferase [Eubacteriales bacterium]